jgi:hypothetical protein
MKPTSLLVCALSLSPLVAHAGAPIELKENPSWFGGFIAPAVLPGGSASFFGYAGAPSVGFGYRQGIAGVLEFDGLIDLDYFTLSLDPTATMRFLVWHSETVQVAPTLGAGFVFDTGAKYIDDRNFSNVSVRIIPGGTMSYRFTEIAALVADVRVPLDFSLTPEGGRRYQPLAGGGAELYLGEDITAGVMGELGVDVFHQPNGDTLTRLGWSVRIGIGYRLF